MRVFPKPLEIGDEEGFTPEKDIFKRAALGAGMTNLVSNVEDPLVIALDGAWGSGKSTFLKMWAGELRKAGHPVIYFDAFENDYVDDAFAALAREFLELAEESKPASKQVAKKFKDRAVDLGSLLMRGAGRIGMRVAVRASTAGLFSATDIEEVGEEITKEAEDMAAKYVDELLSNPRKQKDVVRSFRATLEELPEQLARDGQAKSLIFIIDELDRCKPIFALNLLERIKHFMLVKNVHFVLGVNMQQLQNSVSYAYGPNLNSAEYLQKFVSLRFDLIDQFDPIHKTKDDLKLYANKLVTDLEIPTQGDSPTSISVGMFVRITRRENGSFRSLERAIGMLALALAFTPERNLRIGPLIGGLILMKLFQPTLFKKAKHGKLTYEEVKDFLELPQLVIGTRRPSIEEMWWSYALMQDLPEQISNWGNDSLFRYSIDSRYELVPDTANNIVDRLNIPD